MFGKGSGWQLTLFAAAFTACPTLAPASALASVDLELFAIQPVVTVGEIVEVEVVMTFTTGADKLVSALQMIFEWDPQKLQLLGHHQDGAVGLLFSGFPADPYNINEEIPPQNGLGLYQAWAPLGNPVAATPDGTLLTTLLFEALEPTSLTAIDILPSAGDPVGYTIVFDGTVPNTNILAMAIGTEVTILPDCPADLDGDGAVGVSDLLLLLSAWGPCPPPGDGECPADLTHDGVVGVGDLLFLLSQWGPCP